MSRFPNPVNEKAARAVAAGVVVQCVAIFVLTAALGDGWARLTVPLAYGFLARVAAGPTFSPLGQLATRVIAPRVGAAKFVPGPPKRFAQAVGATLSVASLVLVAIGQVSAALVLVGLILVAATLESALGYCVGCRVFAALMRVGLIPESACEACNSVGARLGVG